MTKPSSTAAEAELDMRAGGLTRHERWWCSRWEWLEEMGFTLRPHYQSGWKPSWLGTSRSYMVCEDGQSIVVSFIYQSCSMFSLIAY